MELASSGDPLSEAIPISSALGMLTRHGRTTYFLYEFAALLSRRT